MKKLLRYLGPLLALLLFIFALFVVHHLLQKESIHDIVRQVRAIPTRRMLVALLMTAGSYWAITGYDYMAFRYIRHNLPYRRISFAAFISSSYSNNIGMANLAGASLRYRFYSAWGLSSVEITKVLLLNTLAFWVGFLLMGGSLFILEPLHIPPEYHLPFQTLRPLGVILLSLSFVLISLVTLRKKPLRFRGWEADPPSIPLMSLLLVFFCLDWILAGSTLYYLMPAELQMSLPLFLALYLLATIIGLISHVPGGLGVFESVILVMSSSSVAPERLVGALLVFRLVYYLFPLGLATILLGANEVYERRARLRRVASAVGDWVPSFAPTLLSIGAFICGTILLFSGSTPAAEHRLHMLSLILPLPAVEISHFLSSLAGLGLLLVARGLQRRLDGAFLAAVLLLCAGVIFSLMKGLDYEESIALLILLMALLPARSSFYRHASLLHEPFTPQWNVAIIIVMLCSIWLGIFSFKHVEFSSQLWWQFAFNAEASRFLRADVTVAVVAMVFAITKLLSPAPAEPGPPANEDLDTVERILQNSPSTMACLALAGDKTLLFNARRNAFIMYNVEGRSWVSLGDPVGPPEEHSELIWSFRELCDRHGGWPVFYQASAGSLPRYVDLGLSFYKLGEEARVSLRAFNLEGPSRKNLRHSWNQVHREGCTMRILSPGQVREAIPQLHEISDEWLAAKNTREKRFSVGFFDEAYLSRLPMAVIEQGERIVAFANLLSCCRRDELSVDLMRHRNDAPQGVMDFLFIELMLWGREQGFDWFNLGGAPLSGIPARPVSPLWNRLGVFVYNHGEHFYNFQGLRQYKDKFHPVWEPRYLISPGGLALPVILTNIASLISGGLKGIVTK